MSVLEVRNRKSLIWIKSFDGISVKVKVLRDFLKSVIKGRNLQS